MADFNMSKDTNTGVRCAYCDQKDGSVMHISDVNLHERCAIFYITKPKSNETRFQVVDHTGEPSDVLNLFQLCHHCNGLELRCTNRLKSYRGYMSHGDWDDCPGKGDPYYLVYCGHCNCVVSGSVAVRDDNSKLWCCVQCRINIKSNEAKPSERKAEKMEMNDV